MLLSRLCCEQRPPLCTCTLTAAAIESQSSAVVVADYFHAPHRWHFTLDSLSFCAAARRAELRSFFFLLSLCANNCWLRGSEARTCKFHSNCSSLFSVLLFSSQLDEIAGGAREQRQCSRVRCLSTQWLPSQPGFTVCL